MLGGDWETVDEARGSGWKGRGTALAELLNMHTSAAPDPLQIIKTISGSTSPPPVN